MNENDIDYCHFWHMKHWNKPVMAGSGGVTLTAHSGHVDTPAATNIIKYQKTPWLDGLRERKLPPCLIPWPLVSVDA